MNKAQPFSTAKALRSPSLFSFPVLIINLISSRGAASIYISIFSDMSKTWLPVLISQASIAAWASNLQPFSRHPGHRKNAYLYNFFLYRFCVEPYLLNRTLHFARCCCFAGTAALQEPPVLVCLISNINTNYIHLSH